MAIAITLDGYENDLIFKGSVANREELDNVTGVIGDVWRCLDSGCYHILHEDGWANLSGSGGVSEGLEERLVEIESKTNTASDTAIEARDVSYDAASRVMGITYDILTLKIDVGENAAKLNDHETRITDIEQTGVSVDLTPINDRIDAIDSFSKTNRSKVLGVESLADSNASKIENLRRDIEIDIENRLTNVENVAVGVSEINARTIVNQENISNTMTGVQLHKDYDMFRWQDFEHLKMEIYKLLEVYYNIQADPGATVDALGVSMGSGYQVFEQDGGILNFTATLSSHTDPAQIMRNGALLWHSGGSGFGMYEGCLRVNQGDRINSQGLTSLTYTPYRRLY